ncbi:MAG TPA: FkbM family methyltransferase [Candidatus Paceibacterota bacterium]|nr:FkbM family methyltransferase [Verrucomicrobiota bacterium]HRY47333.1 FkbM family methyltransferase [Candidatus Paceibacterota bacterium]HSA03131.1 FkbM family methyltransferase [Candidatus Paceibacterota bacterium]
MLYTWLRIYILLWNNSPAWIQRTCRATGLHPWLVRLLTSYRRAPHHPSEDGVVQTLSRRVKSGSLVIDVGANFGVMTEVMARTAGPTGLVIAFEANPDNAEVLSARCQWLQKQSSCAPIEVRNQAVNDGQKSEVALHAGRRHSANEWTITGKDVTGRATEAAFRIPATSLDAALLAQPRPVQLVKIDVEGAEDQVFAGMLELARKHRPTLLIEFHNDQTWEKRRHLMSLGYRFYRLDGTSVGDRDVCEPHVMAVWQDERCA